MTVPRQVHAVTQVGKSVHLTRERARSERRCETLDRRIQPKAWRFPEVGWFHGPGTEIA
jgi:hypothetical protein